MLLTSWLKAARSSRVRRRVRPLDPAAAERLEDRTLLAATALVDTLADEDDGNFSAGDLSLREALKTVDAGGTVTFAAALSGGTITLGGTEILLDRNLTIDGLGSTLLTVSGNNASRIFNVAAGASVRIGGLTIERGFGASDIPKRDGGAIINFGALSLDDIVLRDSTASFRGAILFNEGTVDMTGGAVLGAFGTEAIVNQEGSFTAVGTRFADNADGVFYNWATLSIADSAFEGNREITAAAIYNFGFDAETTVLRSTFTGNETTLAGGVIVNQGNTFRIADSVFAGNSASSAGAIKNFSGVMTIAGSTFSGNVARTFHGGAIENSGTLEIVNSTISGNEAGWYGGAIYAWSGTATLRNVTITGNRVNLDGFGFENGAGIYLSGDAAIVLHNTIVAGNFRGAGAGVAEDVFGVLSASSSHNLIGTLSFAGGLSGGAGGNIIGIDWRTILDPVLRNNGGRTMTHALVPGSAAVDAGSNAKALDLAGLPLAFEQRGSGYPRVLRTRVDIGAFEHPGAPPAARNDLLAVYEDTASAGSLFADNASGSDVDPDGDGLAVTAVNGLSANVGATITLASGASLRVNADGTFSYDPNGKFESLGVGESATETFTYTITDSFGGTSTATATIVVAGVNDSPLARNDAFSAGEDVVTSGGLLADNGSGADSDTDGDALTVLAVNGHSANVGVPVTLASGAKLTLNANGSFSYDPNRKFEGLRQGDMATDSFTYTVSDGHGGTATATVTVSIAGADDLPVARSDAATVAERGTVAGTLLSNDSDADGDPLVVSAVNGAAAVGATVTLTSGALLTVNADGTFSFDPNGKFEHLRQGERATESFTYTASDGRGGSATASVVVTIVGGGAVDLLGYHNGIWRVGSSTGSSFDSRSWTAWQNLAWDALTQGDFDGDGRTDVLGLFDGTWQVGLARGNGTSVPFHFLTDVWGIWENRDWRNVTAGDVNGDGKDDVLARVGGSWHAALSTGASFVARTLWASWHDAPWGSVALADLDGDGKDDLLANARGQWHAALSSGSLFGQRTLWSAWSDLAWEKLGTFDADGDGRADVVGFYRGTWQVGRSTGNGFATGLLSRWAVLPWKDPIVGDFDGDGKGDVAARAGGLWQVTLATGATGVWEAWPDEDWKDVRAADFDGDGRDDLVARRIGGNLRVALSTGSAFNSVRWGQWADVIWKAVAAADAGPDAALVAPAASSPVASAMPASLAARAATDDEPLAAFWRLTDEDDKFASLVIAG